MKAIRAPTAPGAMLYHSMLNQVLTCATSFHQLYSMMKLAAVGIAQPINANATNARMKTRICEGRIRAIFECPAVALLRGQEGTTSATASYDFRPASCFLISAASL